MSLSTSPRALPVLPNEGGRRGPDRSADRRIAFAGMVGAAGFLGLALATLLLPLPARLGIWLPLHLALAGGAGTAIAAMLPFFTAALSVSPPAAAPMRAAGLILVAGGALAVAAGHARGADPAAVAGGLSYLGGVAVVAISAFRPLRLASGQRRAVVEWAYALALLDLALGVTFGTAFMAGNPLVVERWAWLKPAHAWLNLFGFVTLVIAGTLVHLAPTVAGSRIRPRPAAGLAVAGLGLGAPSVALAYAMQMGPLALPGAVLTIAGAAALVVHGLGARRDRAGWTTEREWHRFSTGSLLAAPAWLLVATMIAGWRLAVDAGPASWRVTDVLAPVALGFVVQTLMGAWTHLLPAVGPGMPGRHAVQRRILGWAATQRLLAWNAGVAVLAATLVVPITAPGMGALPLPAVQWIGIIVSGTTLAVAVVLLAAAVLVRPSGTARGARRPVGDDPVRLRSPLAIPGSRRRER